MELGELIGVKGKTDEQTFENWIKACEQLKKDIDIPETILDWLLEAHPEKTAEEWEAEFLAAVDQMSEWAFHDACTGCNPVYPTIAELKGCYLKAFYGEKKYAEKYGDIWEVPVTLPTGHPRRISHGSLRRSGRGKDRRLQLSEVPESPISRYEQSAHARAGVSASAPETQENEVSDVTGTEPSQESLFQTRLYAGGPAGVG